MTRKLNTNVHVVSHIKEKIVHIDAETQAECQKLSEIDEDIAKVSNVYQFRVFPISALLHSPIGNRPTDQLCQTMKVLHALTNNLTV